MNAPGAAEVSGAAHASTMIERLLGLDRLSLSDAGATLEFARPLPMWAWVFLAAAMLAAAIWSYARLSGPTWVRMSLACVRSLVLLLIAVMIAGPQLSKPQERVERDWIVLLLDRSASLGIADVDSPEGRITREAQLRASLSAAWPAWREVSANRGVLVLGFDASAYDLPTNADGIQLNEPEGRRTRLAEALERALRRTAGKPLAGIVVVSDGRSADAASRALLNELESRQTPVYAVALGSDAVLADVGIGAVEAPSAAFAGDAVPVTVRLDHAGAQGADRKRGVVRLVDTLTGRTLDEKPFGQSEDAESERVTLVSTPEAAGASAWEVVVEPEGLALTRENKRAEVRLDVSDRPIRVLLLDGGPRWEYRFLRGTLVRERSIRSTALILASDRRYIQEGTDLIESMPRTQEAWNAFDVVVIGDLRPELLSEEQQRQIRELVSRRGAGVMWLAGQGATPGAWMGTALGDLVPFALPQGARGIPSWEEPVSMKPTPGATRLGVLRLGETAADPWPTFLSDASRAWTLMRWAQKVDRTWLKPTAEVLLDAAPTNGSGSPTPLVVTMRYGAGRVVYVGTDEIYRLRFARGETLPERFWIPLLRLLARESLGRQGKPALLTATPETASVDQSVQVAVRLLDQRLIDARPRSINVRLSRRAAGGIPQRSIELTLRPGASGESGDTFSATWIADDPGVYDISVTDAVLSGLELSAVLRVAVQDDELREPRTDHPALAALAQATGGEVVPPDRLGELPALLPNRELRILGQPTIETLWDSPLAWIILMVLVCTEWIGRRLIRLA